MKNIVVVLAVLLFLVVSLIMANIIDRDVIDSKFYYGRQNVKLILTQKVSKESYINNSWYVITTVYVRNIFLYIITIEYDNLEVCDESELEKVKEKELELGREVFNKVDKHLRMKSDEKD